jgi:phospholipid/cholesterol/gamma-HCH transport system substrate-binding protein
MGILGDKHVEIFGGEESDPPLAEGGQILNVKDQGSLDNIITKVGDIADSLKKVSDNLADAVSDDGTNKHILGRIVLNIEKLTADLSQITGENKQQIGEIVDQVHDITTSLDELINDDSNEGFKKTWKRTMVRIDSIMKNIDEVAAKVNSGQGTIGKLINDDTTVEELNTAIQGVSNLLDGASRIETALDFHGDYLGEIGETKTNIGIQIKPGLDRFYYIGIISDPAGVVRETDTVHTDNGSGTETLNQNEKKTYKNRTKFTILYGLNFWDFSVRGGIIEDRGGLGIDYNFFRKKLKLSVDAFNFDKMNLRFNARYNLFWGLYVQAGIDDSLDNNKRKSGYLGAGLFLSNDDLKLLLTKASF